MVRASLFLACCAAVLPLAVALQAEEADAAALVKELSSEDFDARKRAEEQLVNLGEAAAPALEEAAKNSADPDIRGLAARLLTKLNMAAVVLMVYDRDGKPAAGAEGNLTINNNFSRQETPAKHTFAIGADGRFRLPQQKPGTLYAQVQFDNRIMPNTYGSQQHSFHAGDNPMLLFVGTGGKVSGRVTGPDGKPLRDARVVLQNAMLKIDADLLDLAKLDTQIQHNTELQRNIGEPTGAEGKFEFDKLPDGAYRAFVVHDQFRAAAGPVFRVREGRTVALPDLQVGPPRKETKVEFVFLAADGKPAKNLNLQFNFKPVFATPDAEARWKQMQALSRGFTWRDSNINTDGDGKYTLDKQAPGKYTVRAMSGGMRGMWFGRMNQPPPMVEYGAEITLTGDTPTQTVELKPLSGVAVKGKILLADGKPCENAQLQLYLEREAVENDIRQDYYGTNTSMPRAAALGKTGEFEFKDVPPGRYLALIRTGGPPIIVYGIVVKEKEPAVVADIKLPPRPASVGLSEVKGKILLPDGKGAVGAQLSLSSGEGHSWGGIVNPDGSFDYSNYGRETPFQAEKLAIKMKGYKSAVVMLNDPQVDPRNIAVTLEKMQYGKLRVEVMDEQGRKLAGAKVYPEWSERFANHFGDTPKKRFERTGRDGVVAFNGLVVGKRRINVAYDGLYLETVPVVAISAEQEALLKVVLKAGLSIEAHAIPPPHVALKDVIFRINGRVGDRGGAYFADATGRCVFTGLAPGTYTVSAGAPGAAGETGAQVEVKAGQTAPVKVQLELKPPAFAAATLPPLSNVRVQVVKPGSWQGQQRTKAAAFDTFYGGYNIAIDGEGRIEYGPLAPGSYDVLLHDHNLISYYSGDGSRRRFNVTRLAGQIEARPLKSFADLAELPATALKPPADTGTLKLDLQPRTPVTPGKRSTLSVHAQLLGDRATASLSTSFNDYEQRRAQPPLEIGTRPPDIKWGGGNDPLSVELPAGVYKLNLTLQWYGTSGQRGAPAEPVTLKHAVVVKPGETLDLGRIEYDIPPPPAPVEGEEADQDHWGETNDMVNTFKP